MEQKVLLLSQFPLPYMHCQTQGRAIAHMSVYQVCPDAPIPPVAHGLPSQAQTPLG